MSKKRAREVTASDTRLIEIYDDLANEDEEIRLKAAYALLSQFSSTTTSIGQHKTILKRLFRGLCSGRKAARLGFSVALTECLSQIFLPYIDDQKISASEILDLLESQTAVDGSTSGQDERDHYFGRLFGAEAIVKSSILSSSKQIVKGRTVGSWERLVEIVCALAAKKPWLREQCGWLFCGCIRTLSPDFHRSMIQALARHKLLRTPEGVAIWLSQDNAEMRARHWDGVWKHGSPLSRRSISMLAEIMKDMKPQQAESDEGMDSQGKAMWSPQLHFAWDLVLQELYQEASEDRVHFKDFWLQAVDREYYPAPPKIHGLFASSSSVERKHWGLLLLAKVFSEAPESAIPHVMTRNAITCLQNQLKANSRYLQRSAQKAVQAMHARVAKEHDLALVILRGMLVDAGALQFDVTTKTKIIERVVAVGNNWPICDFLGQLFHNPPVMNSNEAIPARKTIVDLLATACMHKLAGDPDLHKSSKGMAVHVGKSISDQSPLMQAQLAMEILVKIAFFVHPTTALEVASTSRQYVIERVMVCLEQAVKQRATGRALLRHTVSSIFALESKKIQPVTDFDDKIKAILKDARRRVNTLSGRSFADKSVGQPSNKHISEDDTSLSGDGSEEETSYPTTTKTGLANGSDASHGNDATDGLILLYQLAILQIYSGEADAVTIIEDLNAYHDQLAKNKKGLMGSDVLVEVLLTFASKPSKFLRKISLQAFASFAAHITQPGLQALIRVLEAKENLQGQGEIFHAAELDNDDFEEVNGPNSDMELDSDVEEIADLAGALSAESSDADASSGEDESGEEKDNDQLAAFDAMLAAALGTRTGEDDLAASDTSGSDEDMSDSEMEALDEKLTEVFRARKELAKPKKQQHKDARENIVNLKNRVLDLVDVYLRQEYATSLSLQLILPLLRLARRTNTKQLADRARGILREFNGRCRGTKLPQLVRDDDVEAVLDILKAIHLEACRPGSNAHGAACSSASILLVRILAHAGVGARTLWDIYAATGTKMLEDRDCHVQPAFFTDWNNWCANTRKGVAK